VIAKRTLIAAAVVLGSLLPTAGVLAQAAAPPQFTDAVVMPPAESEDETVWTLQLGGTFNYGNTRSFQLATATHFVVRRDAHLFTADLAFTYGIASLRSADTQQFGPWNANAQNFNGRLRYDGFLDPDDALFVSVAGRNDPFAGLDFRFQGQFGYMRNLLREADGTHRLWFEIGGDITYDDRYPNPLCGTPPMGVTIDRTTCLGDDTVSYLLPPNELQPSARLFVGYDNHMDSHWSYRTGVELLVDLRGAPYWENVRANWTNELHVTIDANLAAGLTFNLLVDGQPVPGRDPVDTQTILTVVYTLM
jgi:hypothetical protein